VFGSSLKIEIVLEVKKSCESMQCLAFTKKERTGNPSTTLKEKNNMQKS
jgi:hypothetical protein